MFVGANGVVGQHNTRAASYLVCQKRSTQHTEEEGSLLACAICFFLCCTHIFWPLKSWAHTHTFSMRATTAIFYGSYRNLWPALIAMCPKIQKSQRVSDTHRESFHIFMWVTNSSTCIIVGSEVINGRSYNPDFLHFWLVAPTW